MVAIQKQAGSESTSLNRGLDAVPWRNQLEQLQHQRIVARDRLHWMLQLREVLDNAHYSVDDYSADEYQLMLSLAVRLCDWVIVLHLCDRVQHSNLQLKLESFQANMVLDCAEAFVQMGVPNKALNHLRPALFQYYQNPDLFSYYRFVQEKDENSNSSLFPWQARRKEELLLAPLEAHHLEAFRWVYSQYALSNENDCWEEQSIAQLCNLPRFKNDLHWHHWLTTNQESPNQHVFAINHQEWGFIGSVSLEVFNGVGFFYYWLGEDFQGHGFGPKAANILLALGADYLDMHCCYAKVYDYNQPSQKALQKMGFERLGFKVKAPHDNEVLYYLGTEKTEGELRTELGQLIVDMESSLELVSVRECTC